MLHIHRKFFSVAAVICALCAGAVQPHASRAAQTSVVDDGSPEVGIRVLLNDEAIEGAFVSLVPTDSSTGLTETLKFGGITEGNGIGFSGIMTGSYTMTVSYAGATLYEEVVGLGVGSYLTRVLTTTLSPFRGLGAYGAQVGTIVADGRSGTFYLNTTGVPSLFRTTNYGGFWAPVTLREDSSSRGLTDSSIGKPATSGYAGEVAVVADGKIWYSQDFGNTWASFSLPGALSGGPNGPQLLWGRVGYHSVLMAESGGAMGYAVMPNGLCTAPTTLTMLSGPANFMKNAATDRIHVANGGASPFVAVAANDGTVTLYELRATVGCGIDDAEAAPSYTVSGFPVADPTFVRLGGTTAVGQVLPGGVSEAPATILAYYNSVPTATMATYNPGWELTTDVEFRNQGDDGVNAGGAWNSGGSSCGAQPGSVGALAGNADGVGTVSQCWVTKDGAKLVARFVQGINNNTGFAFDADYDGTTNMVVISGDGENGAVKSAYIDPVMNRPVFGDWPQLASSGTMTMSGGLSLRGVRTPVVRDTAVGPNPNEIVTVLSFTGGGRVLGSVNSGRTFFDIPQRMNFVSARGAAVGETQDGGMAVDWWAGASGTHWLMVNAGGGGNTLWLTDTSSITTTSGLARLPGTEFGPQSDPKPIAIGGVPGSDVAYVGLGDRQDNSQVLTAGGIYKMEITGTEGAYTMISQTLGITNGVPAIDACGVSATSPTAVTDTVFAAVAATGNSTYDGTILRFSGATGTPVQESVSVAGANFRDVRVACEAAEVWAGAYVNSDVGLFHSTDGGATFVQISSMAWTTDTTPADPTPLLNNLRSIETLAISPDDSNIVMVVSKDGDVVSTADGGATWAVVNNVSGGGKRFGAELPGDVEIPAAAAGRGRRAAADARAVLGSSAGMYSASLTPSDSSGGESSDATLSTLTAPGLALNPAFSSGVTNYTASVPNATSALTFNWAPADGGAAVAASTGAGPCPLGVCPLSVGVNTITVTVTAADGVAVNAYVIQVSRAAAPGGTIKVYVPLAVKP